jgi:hypothetical protein
MLKPSLPILGSILEFSKEICYLMRRSHIAAEDSKKPFKSSDTVSQGFYTVEISLIKILLQNVLTLQMEKTMSQFNKLMTSLNKEILL